MPVVVPRDEPVDEAAELRRIVAERDAEIARLREQVRLRDEHRRECPVCANCTETKEG